MTSRELFNRLDRRGKGALTATDLLAVVADLAQCRELISSLNTDSENASSLSYEDFQRGFHLETTAVGIESSESEASSPDEPVQSESPHFDENTSTARRGKFVSVMTSSI